MSVLIVIQARMGSTRLPGKVLLRLRGKTVIEHVLNACIDAEWTSVLAMPLSDENTVLSDEASMYYGRSVFVGDNLSQQHYMSEVNEDDVLGRIWEIAEKYNRDHVVRLTGDCPMLTNKIISDVIYQHIDNRNDFTYNSDAEQGDGIDVEVMKMSVLKECHEQATSSYDREHVTSWIRSNPKYKKLRVDVPDYPTRSINTLDDYVWVHQHWRKE